jgi:hypothetical protein
MEAIGGRSVGTAGRAAVPGPRTSPLRSVPDTGTCAPGQLSSTAVADTSSSDGGAFECLRQCLALAEATAGSVPDELALAGFREAADFADLAEELSRRVDHLQLLAAAAVDRTRTAAINAAGPAAKAAGWTTGWGTATDNAAGDITGTGTIPAAPGPGPARSVPADDGCRNTAEFLRIRLRISIGEARRRLALAAAVLPRTGLNGHPMPPACEATAANLAAGTIASRAGTIITTALDKARPITDPATLHTMETALNRTAQDNDHDFLLRIAHRWSDAIDQDGTEPTEEDLRHRQGAFTRRPRRGLHHLEIFATTDQYEHLLTAMNTATNPRTQPTTNTGETGPGTSTGENDEDAAGGADNAGGTHAAGTQDSAEDAARTGPGFGAAAEAAAADAHLERRTRPQQLLDGLVGACKTALATATLPATGGLRPQVMVTISYQDLLDRLQTTATNGPRYTRPTPTPRASTAHAPEPHTDQLPGQAPDTAPATTTGQHPLPGTPTGTGTFAFTGPVTPATVRKIACDADIIPVLLGSQGRILDIGHTTRIFPPHLRKALTARDQGCAFPTCTIPAPWCEAHHTTYWSHGGPTSTDNGVLLCTHHHHLIHKEQWTIHLRTGIPWFTPPPHLDPHQKPQRNHHFRE